MKYITGLIALGTPCELDTPGLWTLRKSDYLSDENMKTYESNEFPFKDFGIELNKIVDYHEFCVYNVANHIRAYLDLLYLGKFELLKGLFPEAINSAKARLSIFECVYRCRRLAQYRKMNEFMLNEFGNVWISYKDAIESSAESIAKLADIYNEAIAGKVANVEIKAPYEIDHVEIDINKQESA